MQRQSAGGHFLHQLCSHPERHPLEAEPGSSQNSCVDSKLFSDVRVKLSLNRSLCNLWPQLSKLQGLSVVNVECTIVGFLILHQEQLMGRVVAGRRLRCFPGISTVVRSPLIWRHKDPG